MYIFKYHPDNTVYQNGAYTGTYAEFIAANPGFPLVEGEYFEYSEGEDGSEFATINNEGHHIPANAEDYADLITAINNL